MMLTLTLSLMIRLERMLMLATWIVVLYHYYTMDFDTKSDATTFIIIYFLKNFLYENI